MIGALVEFIVIADHRIDEGCGETSRRLSDVCLMVRRMLESDGETPATTAASRALVLPTAAELLADVLAGDPGPESIALLHAIAEDEPLTAEARVLLAKAWERVGSWVAAQQHRAIRALAGDDVEPCAPGDRVWDATVPLAGAVLHLSPGQAWRRVQTTRALMERFPATFAALENGQISAKKATTVTDVLSGRSSEACDAVEQSVLARADGMSDREFRRALDAEVMRIDPANEEARVRKHDAARGMTMVSTKSGIKELCTSRPHRMRRGTADFPSRRRS